MADENEWQFLGSDDNLGGADDNLSVSHDSKNLFQLLVYAIAITSNVNLNLTHNNNNNSVYAYRRIENGITDSLEVSETKVRLEHGLVVSAGQSAFAVVDEVSILGEEKLGIAHLVANSAGTGAGTAPERSETVLKFVPSPDAEITQTEIDNPTAGSFNTDSSLDVAGAD